MKKVLILVLVIALGLFVAGSAFACWGSWGGYGYNGNYGMGYAPHANTGSPYPTGPGAWGHWGGCGCW
jgi:hypothetical protein